jgi:putative transposase
VKSRAIATLNDTHDFAVLLELLGIARSTYYYHAAQRDRVDPHTDVKAAIQETLTVNKKRYGHRRIHAVLRQQGRSIAKSLS